MDDLQLEAFQQALLEILAGEESCEAVQRKLRSHPAAAPFRDAVEGYEPRMLELARILVRRWGKQQG